MKKWLVCGGRDATPNDARYVNDVLDRIIILEGRPSSICEGECRGYDLLAKAWAKERCVTCVPFPVKWKVNGKLDRGAGLKLNQQMLDEFKPDIVVAFPGKDGTSDMISRARKAGVKVIRIPSPESLGYGNIRRNQQPHKS